MATPLRAISPAIFAFFVALAFAWSAMSWNLGAETIRTSDTTDTFYRIVMESRDHRAAIVETHSPLISQIWRDQVATWRVTPFADLYQALFDSYLKTVYIATGDVTLAYKLLVFPLNLAFLFGCQALFWHITGRPWLSVSLSVLASLPITLPLAGENFGMGPYVNYSRRHLLTAFVPFATFLFLYFQEKRSTMLWVFGFFGLIANLHASGIILVEIGLLAYLMGDPGHSRRWISAGLMGLTAALSGSIALGNLLERVITGIGQLATSWITHAYASTSPLPPIPEASQYLFYPPHIFSHLPDSLVNTMSAAVCCLAIAPPLLKRRLPPQQYLCLLFVSSLSILAFLAFSELKYWLMVGLLLWALPKGNEWGANFELACHLIIATFLASFASMIVLQIAYLGMAGFPLIENQLRGVRFIGLFAYVWLAVLVRAIDWRVVGKGAFYSVVIITLGAVLPDTRQLIRDHFRETDRSRELEALADVANWARNNTPSSSKFLVASSVFGIVSEREVYSNDKRTRVDASYSGVSTNRASVIELARDRNFHYAVLRKEGVKSASLPEAVYENYRFALLKVR